MYREIQENEVKLDKTLGYLYFIDTNHPLATGNSGRVYLHRHIKSLQLNRWLTSKEVVHHIDENRINNELTNLEILSQEEHASVHLRKLEDRVCIQCNKLYRPKTSKQKYCSRDCVPSSNDISVEDIVYWVKNYSWVRAGKELGITDNGLRKKYKKLTGLDPKLLKVS
jgi:hypothetical protein